MKQVTVANKLAELLGITDADTSHFEEKEAKKSQAKKHYSPTQIAVYEDELQKFREAEGLIYFLQAPELFKPNTCKQCGEGFLVSRQNVSHCSYLCVQKHLAALGIEWSRYGKFEELAQDFSVWNGNEPLIIRHLDRIRAVLDRLSNA